MLKCLSFFSCKPPNLLSRSRRHCTTKKIIPSSRVFLRNQGICVTPMWDIKSCRWLSSPMCTDASSPNWHDPIMERGLLCSYSSEISACLYLSHIISLPPARSSYKIYHINRHYPGSTLPQQTLSKYQRHTVSEKQSYCDLFPSPTPSPRENCKPPRHSVLDLIGEKKKSLKEMDNDSW